MLVVLLAVAFTSFFLWSWFAIRKPDEWWVPYLFLGFLKVQVLNSPTQTPYFANVYTLRLHNWQGAHTKKWFDQRQEYRRPSIGRSSVQTVLLGELFFRLSRSFCTSSEAGMAQHNTSFMHNGLLGSDVPRLISALNSV